MYKNSNFKTFILIFGISFSSIFAHTEPVVLLDQDTSSKNISSLIEYRYRDQKFAGCSPNHIDGLEDLEWHSISADVLRVKRTSFGNWLRFSVQNSEPTIQNRILLLGWLNVPDTQLCFFDKNGKFVSVKSGYSNPTTDEKILTTLPHFKIDLQPNENRIFYLFVLSNEDINYQIRIMGLEEFELHKRLKFITSYSIVGIIGFAVLYSFFGYYRFKNSTFIFSRYTYFQSSSLSTSFMDVLLRKFSATQIIYFDTAISYFSEPLTCFYFYICSRSTRPIRRKFTARCSFGLQEHLEFYIL
ncbi:7TMR-DISM extracellular 2 [Leptospira borgpetersenii str. Noumea 25]|nr:7TMR-DISM extracellular 2 [Leptospira borgpetersenii str. Noumea 25]